MAGPDAVVLGAGVIGLTSAVLLAESGLAVECWTADPPAETTSRVAGALWAAPPLEDPDGGLARWAGVSLAVVRRARRASPPAACASPTASWPRGHRAGEPRQMFPGVQLRAADPPDGCVAAFELDAPLIDMPRYLEYLQRAPARRRARRS